MISHVEWISWHLKKPADLDLHCFQYLFMSGFILFLKEFVHDCCQSRVRAYIII